MSSKGRDVLKLSAVIAVAFGVGLTAASAFNLPRSGVAQPRVASAPPRALGSRTLDGLPSFAEVVGRVNPSVVYIRTDHVERGGGAPDLRGMPPELGNMLRQNQQPRRV